MGFFKACIQALRESFRDLMCCSAYRDYNALPPLPAAMLQAPTTPWPAVPPHLSRLSRPVCTILQLGEDASYPARVDISLGNLFEQLV
jgi:hypothetical protein